VKALGEFWPWLGITAAFAVIAGAEAAARRRRKPDVSHCTWEVPDPVPAAVTVRAIDLLARGDPLGTECVEEVQGVIYLRRIEAANRQRRREGPGITRLKRQGESDDEVRANVPPDLVALFERVKRSIKASPRMSRTEAFLKYDEEHPSEVLEAIDDKTDALIRELERKEREAARALRRGPPRPPRYTPEQLEEVPF
jgi:hypothetical protein